MARSYTMRGAQATADEAVTLARAVLGWREPGSRIHDVQTDPRFQHRGVDLLWETAAGSVAGVEVKGDRHGASGNYFFELVSNLEKDTPGCFLYSEADLLVYVFVREREVHEVPLRAAREWFLGRSQQFPIRRTHTRLGKAHYTTLGALVPIAEVAGAVAGLVRYRVGEDGAVARVGSGFGGFS